MKANFGELMKAVLNLVCAFLTLPALASLAFGADASPLKPPTGAKVAIVMFEDMECPSCAANYPLVEEAGKAHHVPVVLRDFPLGPKHPWSFEAAVWARYFDKQGEEKGRPELGREFRAYIFKNQPQITPGNLRQFVEKFGNDNHIPVPFAADPEGKLRALVQADHDLGMSIGINQTPTIFVVSKTESRQVEKVDQLPQLLDDMQKAATPATPAKKTAAKKKTS
jgi:protein-disulfide isomerase